MNKQLEESIKQLESLKRDRESFITDDKEHDEIYLKDIEAIETTIRELKRLQGENNKLKRANKTYINSIQSITPVLLEDYIEKDKIKEKIEEQEELKEKYLKMREYGQVDIRLYKIAILEELLEEK